MTPNLANTLRIAVIAAAGLASVATSQVEPGEREDGGCPADETCSDATPTGLYFGGALSGARGLLDFEWTQTIAVGGSQTIRLFEDADGEVPFSLPFVASTTGPGLSVVSETRSAVVVRADALTSGRLRITEPDNGLLYDRVMLRSAELDRVRLLPAGYYNGQDWNLLLDDVSFAVLRGSRVRVTAALYDAADARVIDEGLTIDSSAPHSPDPEGFFDTVEVDASGDAIGLVVTSAGQVVRASLPVVAAPDELRGSVGALYVGSAQVRCFRPLAAGAFVAGASFSYRAEGDIGALAQAEDDVVSGCIEITPARTGTLSLTVTASGYSQQFTYDVVEGSRAAAAPPAAERYLAGDRAENVIYYRGR